MFLFCFNPWHYQLNIRKYKGKGNNVFSITIHVCLPLILKRCGGNEVVSTYVLFSIYYERVSGSLSKVLCLINFFEDLFPNTKKNI